MTNRSGGVGLRLIWGVVERRGVEVRGDREGFAGRRASEGRHAFRRVARTVVRSSTRWMSGLATTESLVASKSVFTAGIRAARAALQRSQRAHQYLNEAHLYRG